MSTAPNTDRVTERAARWLASLALVEQAAPQSDQMVRRAILAANGRAGRQDHRFGILMSATAGALMLAIALALAPSQPWQGETRTVASSSAPSPVTVAEPSRLYLPSGDGLHAAQGTRFEVRSAAPERREVAVQHGQMLFDVARLGGGQRFEVSTPELQVSVIGTVFTVETVDGRTVVRVYEGEVGVVHEGRKVHLRVGDHFVSDGSTPSPDPLSEHALAAATRRRAMPPTQPLVVEVMPAAVPTPAPAGVAAATSNPSRAQRRTRRAPPTDVREARLALDEGRVESSLAAAEAAIQRGEAPLGQWYLVRAEALMHQGRVRLGAGALESAAVYLKGRQARDVAYRAAIAYFERLGDPARAWHVLKASGVVGPDKFVTAHGLELRVRLLLSLQRPWEASAVARRYLRAYPHAAGATYMRGVVDYSQLSLVEP